MASQSRGAIEEGKVNFVNTSEVDVEFAGASAQNKNFPSVPIVKLISVLEAKNNMLYAAKDLLYKSGAFVPTYPTNGTLSDEDHTVNSTGATPLIPADYRILRAEANRSLKFKKIGENGFITVPFDNSYTTNDALIQVFFQLDFSGVAFGNTDSFHIHFVDSTTIDNPSDSTPNASNQRIKAKYVAYVGKKVGSIMQWQQTGSSTSQVAAVGASAFLNQGINLDDGPVWVRLDITRAPKSSDNTDIKLIKGLGFAHLARAAGFFHLSDVSVVIWNGADGDDSWEDLKDDNFLLTAQERDWTPTSFTPSNIGVTFTNVTINGMKVIATAPFTGVVRYLCSVQG